MSAIVVAKIRSGLERSYGADTVACIILRVIVNYEKAAKSNDTYYSDPT